MSSRSARRARRAFTLVEILVVIGVLTLLIAALMPAIGSARKHALAATCANRMREVYAAIIAYANDNQGRVPKPPPLSDKNWNSNNGQPDDQTGRVKKENYAWVMTSAGVANFEIGTLVNYLGPDVASRQRLMQCPADPGYGHSAWFGGRSMPHNFSYAFNGFMNLFFVDGPAMRITKIHDAADKVLIWEQRAPYDGLVCFCGGYVGSNDLLPDWHFGMSNEVFADGHIQLARAPKNTKEAEDLFYLTKDEMDCGSHWKK